MEARAIPDRSANRQFFTNPENTEYVEVGPLVFGIEYRFLWERKADGEFTDIVKDLGISVHVFEGGTDQSLERLRFDCFLIRPHYHYFHWPEEEEHVWLDTAVTGDPFQWTLDCLRTKLPAMLPKSGADELARSLDQRDIEAALPKIAAYAEALKERVLTNLEGPVHLSGAGR